MRPTYSLVPQVRARVVGANLGITPQFRLLLHYVARLEDEIYVPLLIETHSFGPIDFVLESRLSKQPSCAATSVLWAAAVQVHLEARGYR